MNYKHLHYFWTVVRAGGVVSAAEQLHLTPQTLGSQIRQLEDRLGQRLLRKAGRGVGQSRIAFFAAPALLPLLAAEIARQYQVAPIGTAADLVEEFYGISVERRITHPAVAAITRAARGELFAQPQR